MQSTLAFDTETHLFSNGCLAPPIVCLQWDDKKAREILVGEAIRPFIKKALIGCAKGRHTLVGQNTAYDMTVLAAAYPDLFPLIFAAYESGNVECTRLRERLIDIARGRTGPETRQRSYYSMDIIVKRRDLPIQVDKNNPWRLRYAELDGVPLTDWPPEAVAYAIEDPTATRLIYEDQHEDAMAIPYEDAQGRFCFDQEAARQAGFDFALRLMSCWGVRTNSGRIEKLLRRTDAEIAEIVPQLVAAGIMRENGKKNKKVIQAKIAAAFEKEGDPVPVTDAKNPQIKTDKETIEVCNDPDLAKVVRHNYLTKLRSTYILKLIEGVNGTIHANFHTLGADTGRTSSSDPNLQNQSKKGGIRECFVPRDGYVFVSADYDAQELRTLAQACLYLTGHSVLAQRFQADPDFDPHTDFAANLMNWDYKEALTRKEAGDEKINEVRDLAKAANFGFAGGMGIDTFVKDCRKKGIFITKERAKELKDAWFLQWPEMRKFFEHAKTSSELGMMRQLRSNRIRGGVGFCDSANGEFQGLASEASKTAVFLVSRACYAEPDNPMYGCRPVMLVHDEIAMEAPEGRAHEAAMELQRLMVLAMTMWCPDVPARAKPIVSRCWSKKAKQVWENGLLVPWDLPKEKE